jgi:hypothetical protein
MQCIKIVKKKKPQNKEQHKSSFQPSLFFFLITLRKSIIVFFLTLYFSFDFPLFRHSCGFFNNVQDSSEVPNHSLAIFRRQQNEVTVRRGGVEKADAVVGQCATYRAYNSTSFHIVQNKPKREEKKKKMSKNETKFETASLSR